MSDTENKDKTEELPPSETEVESHPAAEHLPDEDLEDLDLADPSRPRLKELLNSSDSPSRYLTILSILFAVLALLCMSLLVFQYLKNRHSEQKEPETVQVAKLEPTITESLGEFRVNWGNAELRVDIVAQCSSKEACEQLKENLVQARDLTLPLLQESSRDEVLNPDRKLLLRKNIAEKLNDLKLNGKVTQIDFSDMTVEVSH